MFRYNILVTEKLCNKNYSFFKVLWNNSTKSFSMASEESFKYTPNDYIFNVSSTVHESSKLSQFDVRLRAKWDEAMSKGCFRYDLSHLQSRVVPGMQKYILQLNSRRLRERRAPENIVSLQMPFDPQKFNFTKVKPEEILFLMEPERSSGNLSNGFAGKAEKEDDDFTTDVYEKNGRHLVLINVSPLEYGHILLVPDADCGIPQRLTLRGIRLAVDLLLLSAHPGLRVGFNSLCALASVNHQHIHAWYLEYPMVVENAEVKKICNNFHELLNFPARGFAFQLHGNSVEAFAGILYKVANFLQLNSIAHNFFMTRGSLFDSSPVTTETTVRAYFWPRKSFAGAKSSDVDVPFNVAVAELAGHIPMYVPELFDKLTEDYITEKLVEVMLPDDEFNAIRDDIQKILTPCISDP